MAGKLIEIVDLSARQSGITALTNVHLTINDGEHWLITGDSGSGKTSLARALIGQLFHTGKIIYHFDGGIELVEQQHRFRTLSNTTDFYYQQRFQSQDSEDSLTIEEELRPYFQEQGNETLQMLQLLHLDSMLAEPLIQLSNGENKRLQLVKALLHKPAMLILDNPFVGLDNEGRELLRKIINDIANKGIHLIIIGSAHEIPHCITHVVCLEKGNVAFTDTKEKFENRLQGTIRSSALDITELLSLPTNSFTNFESAVRMVNVTIQYGDKIILDNVSWEVKKGERWSLSGPNGAGKSTLLSLINADNPQAYANEIYLFDKHRGRGESIWDIKKNIGYVSPEMHLYFPFTSTCFEVIASGLFDTVGLFRPLNDEQEELVLKWILLLKLEDISIKPMHQLSLGHQRMALLARALVKNPPLLVLDEPCQGLDDSQTNFFNQLVDQLCMRFGTTMIYVSHYQSQLPVCVDKHVKLVGGKVC